MEHLLRDLRFAARSLLKSPLFVGVAVLTLGLGLGVNTTIFTFVNAVVLRPLPITNADEVLAVFSRWEGDESYLGTAKLTNTVNYEWPHSIAEVVTALLDAGLVIDHLREYQHLDWRFFPWMEQDGERFVLPEDRRTHLPLQFSVLAHKPE